MKKAPLIYSSKMITPEVQKYLGQVSVACLRGLHCDRLFISLSYIKIIDVATRTNASQCARPWGACLCVGTPRGRARSFNETRMLEWQECCKMV